MVTSVRACLAGMPKTAPIPREMVSDSALPPPSRLPSPSTSRQHLTGRLRVSPISTATNQLQLPGVDIDLPLRLNIPGFWGTVGYGSRHVTIDMRRSDAGSADDFCPPCNPAEQPRHSNFTTNSWSEGRCDMTGPRPAGSPWTQGDDDRLRSLLSSGMKAALIAAKLKRTAGAIRSRANWLRRQAELTSPRSAPTDALKAARMTASAEPAELKARE